MSFKNIKILALNKFFLKLGLSEQSKYLKYLIKKSEGIAGTDFPVEDFDIEGTESVITYLEENPGIPIYLDNPSGTEKAFGKNKIKLPFHYGEFTGLINPSDEMYWDLIVVPSQSGGNIDHYKSGHNLTPIGYISINNDKNIWNNMTGNNEPPPVGNDKIIIADLDSYSKEQLNQDKAKLDNFFSKLWQFNKINWIRSLP